MKTGADSGFAMTRLASKYVEIMKNGRYLSNRHSIEIIRDRVTELFNRLDENDAPDRLAVLEKLWEKYKAQKESGQSVEMVITGAQIDKAFDAARTDFAVWNQMLQLLDLDRKMVESEVKIAKEIKAIMTAEEAAEMVAKLMASIFSAVNSMETISLYDKGVLLKRIQYEFSRITGDNNDATVVAGVESSQPETIDL